MPDLAQWLPPDGASLLALFVASFVAATVLPLASEVWLLALVRARPDLAAAALVVATVGNTLGGLTTYYLGRLGRRAVDPAALATRQADWLRAHGAPALGLAWLPLGGDLLCLLAGYLRLPVVPVTLWMAAGKLARYAALIWLSAQLAS